jgi:hypothetical protein
MDIQQELREIYSRNIDDTRSIIRQAKDYSKELEKKHHILNVLNIAQAIEQLVENKSFEKADTYYIKLSLNNSFSCYDKNRNFLYAPVNKKVEKLSNSTEELFKITLDEKYMGGNLDNFIDLSKPVKEQLFKMLLNKELRTIVEYNQMQIDLVENSQETSKKLKL